MGPNLFFPWLLVFYYLTDAFFLVLFIIYITSTSSIQKHSFVNVLQNRCSKKFSKFHKKTPGWSLFSIKLYLQNTSGGCFYPCYFSRFFFYSFLAALPLLRYSTVTFFVWRKTFVFMSLLLYMINIIIAEWFIRITTNATIYCTAISMIVKRISSALMQFILKQTKKTPINKVQLKNILSFRRVISLICQECLISLNSVLSFRKQTQTY